MIELSKVKCFAHQDVLADTMVYAKSLEIMQTIEDYDIGLYGIIEVEDGDVLFQIDFKYDGEPFVWKRFMHADSFLRYYKHRKMKFLDAQAEKFIRQYVSKL